MSNPSDFYISKGVLLKYKGRASNVTIPDGVVSIGERVFCERPYLKSVTIPDSVTSIGNSAFEGCKKLASINLPYGLKSVGQWAFHGCGELVGIKIPNTVFDIGGHAFSGCNSLTSISIPEGLFRIKEGTFSGCRGLTSVVIPSNVNTIENYAFCGCEGLTTITIPDTVECIEETAFMGCTGLSDANGFVIIRQTLFSYYGEATDVVIPNGVTRIGGYAFWNNKLESIKIPDSIVRIGERVFSSCKNLCSIIIPNGVASIGKNAFSGCSGIACVAIPESITIIGEGAFSDCENIKNVFIPTTVKSIEGAAFRGCKSLVAIELPEGLKTIGNGAFQQCCQLTSIAIPESVERIGEFAFKDCKSLDTICIHNKTASIASNAFDGTAFALETSNQIDGLLYLEDLLIKTIHTPSKCFIKPGTRYICDGAFSKCFTNLTEVVIPESVVSIGAGAFNGCGWVRTITFDRWTEDLGKVVDNCNSHVVIHTQSVPSEIPAERQAYALIGFVQDKETDFNNERAKAYLEYAAQNALNLKPLAFEYSELIQFLCDHKLISVKDVDSFIAEAEKRKDTEKKELLLSYEKTLDMDELTALREKKQIVKDQYEDEFKKRSAQRDSSQGISGLTFVAAGRLKEWKSYADIRKYLEGYGAKLDSTISNKADYLVTNDADIESEKNKKAQELGVRILSEEAFSDMVKYRYLDAERIVVPGWVKEIPENAFENCKNVQTVEICEGTEIIRANAFNECTHLISVHLPETVRRIERYAFRKCYTLRTINLPKGLKKIGAHAFRFCHNLTSITIPDSMEELVFGAFEYCNGLVSVTIPTSVKEIWNDVFRGCEKITIHAPAGSYAEQFAKENGIPFVSI